MDKKKALVAMSGGVDSSVAAYLMAQNGWDCVGAIALIAQAIPMLFFKFDENAIEEKLVEYRKQKEATLESELAVAAE